MARQRIEHKIQMAFFKWARENSVFIPELRLLHAIPNGGEMSSGARLWQWRLGEEAGVPDVHLPVPRNVHASLYIETKKPGGKPTEKQLQWHEWLRREGNAVRVAESKEEMIDIVLAYLRGEDVDPDARAIVPYE